MMPDDDGAALDRLVRVVRDHSGVTNKAAVALVGSVLGGADWAAGPGDDGALVPSSGGGTLVVGGEALLPAFVSADPHAAGMAAVLTNVNDLAAMGAVPLAVVDTIVGTPELAAEVLRGLREAGDLYRVPIVGGHFTPSDGPPAVSAFGLGRCGDGVLSVLRAEDGHRLVIACALEGAMRSDFPFFASYRARGGRLAGDVRLLADLAAAGTAVAARDVSMAGMMGSLAMLLEARRLGATVDLDLLPRPPGLALADWLVCFPGYAFWLCVPPGREDDCLARFGERGLEAAVVGEVDASGVVTVRLGPDRADVFDLRAGGPTGLPPAG